VVTDPSIGRDAPIWHWLTGDDCSDRSSLPGDWTAGSTPSVVLIKTSLIVYSTKIISLWSCHRGTIHAMYAREAIIRPGRQVKAILCPRRCNVYDAGWNDKTLGQI
jgi:hypothetical protein